MLINPFRIRLFFCTTERLSIWIAHHVSIERKKKAPFLTTTAKTTSRDVPLKSTDMRDVSQRAIAMKPKFRLLK